MLEESVSSSPTFWAGLYSWFTPTVFFLLLQLVIATIYITSSLANATHKRHHQPHEQDPHQATNFQQHHQQQLFRSPSVLQRLKSINFYSHPYRSQDAPHTPPHTHTPPQPQLQTHENENPQLARSPSSVLQRLKSINLYNYFPTEPFSHKLTPNTTEKTHEPEKQHVAVMEKEEEENKREDEDEDEDEDEGEGEEEEEDDDVLGQIRNNLGGYEEVGKGEGKFSSLDEVFRQLQGQGGNFARTNSDTKPASGEIPVKLSKKMKKSASSKSAFAHFKEEDIVESRRPATVRESKVAAAADDNEVDAKADDFINKFKQQLKMQRLDSIIRYKDMINRGA